jgi:hypothetical protein
LGKPNGTAAPPRQSTLAFSTKSSNKSKASRPVDEEEDDADEDVVKKENKTISEGEKFVKKEKSSTNGKCQTADLKTITQWTNTSLQLSKSGHSVLFRTRKRNPVQLRKV